MHQDGRQEANLESELSHGGAAPEERRCQYLKADGKACRDWAIRGQGFCYRHGVFVRPGAAGRIDVPLLEDEAAVVLVLSETLRAVVQGAISLKHGALVLDGCRLAHSMQMDRAKAARTGHRVPGTGHRTEAIGHRASDTGHCTADSDLEGNRQEEPGTTKAEAGSSKANHECGAPSSEEREDRRQETSPEPCGRCPEPCGRCSEPDAQCSEAYAQASEFDPRYQEEREGVLAAQAAPADEWREEEAAVGVR